MGEPISQKHLKKYLGWKMRVDNNQERIARAKSEERFAPMRESDGSKHQPGAGDRMGNAILRRMELEQRLLPVINEDTRKMKQIELAINSLDDPFEQEVLTCRYIDGEEGFYTMKSWSDVALQIYGDNDEKHIKAANRLHDRALQSISKFTFEGKEKSHP